jgi:DNA modification methylase
MTIPSTIHLSEINIGERIRTRYSSIEGLSELIEGHGLIQPIVLVPLDQDEVEQITCPKCQGKGSELTCDCCNGAVIGAWLGLDAGGRRYHALKLLFDEGKWDGVLHHAVTSEPGRPGFVLKGSDQATPLRRLMTEIGENLGREDIDWRDEVKAITKAWRLAKADADSKSESLLMRDFGAMLGTGYSDLQAANAVHDDLIANPDFYKDVTGLRAAYSALLKKNATELIKLQAVKSITTVPLSTTSSFSVSAQPEPAPGENSPTFIPITRCFIKTDSIELMKTMKDGEVDHIVTDPDYGVSVERLEASVGGAGEGVHQDTVEQSLQVTFNFLTQAYRVIRDQGFCVFWYDLDHHEKLQCHALSVGFRVQRWPLIWHKTDYRSNASPQHNFCKNFEYAMVCRKPNATLVQVQTNSVFPCPTADTVRQFGHPFAKPLDLSKWIFNAITIKGQTVYDPFLGSGAIACAAVDFGLRPIGSEINPDHYAQAIVNIQKHYKRLTGENVRFV